MATYSITQNAVVEIQVLGRLHGQRTRNVFHYRYTGSTSLDGPTTLDALMDEFEAEILAGWFIVTSSEWMCDGVQCQLISPTRYRSRFKAIAQAGQVQGNSLPTTTCVVLRRTAILSGRRYQGRIYVAGVPTSSENDSQLSAAVLANWTGLASNLKEPLEGGTAVECFVPNLARTAPASGVTDVELTALDPILRIQRRREVGVGE